jgi:putative radical SAM enzyme (TIGR03279 family)
VAVFIKEVQADTPAALAGITGQDKLISINGHPIIDVLDYRFYETNRNLELVLKRENSVRTVSIHKGQYEPIGLEFETYLMDQQHSCANRCIFCFIDQLPKGMRETLYFKDDDSRLSFLFGNYITMTNLSDREVDRIIQMHISPINISVHTTNPELRCKMMGNRLAGKSLKYLYRLAKANTKINCQLVLCPGINDGEELERTLSDLSSCVPAIQSIALVPLGVTKYRDGLYPLVPYTPQQAKKVIDQAEAWGERFFKKYGNRICYAADEFYLKANLPIPDAEFYGDFDQLENGVGLLASQKQEFEMAAEDFKEPSQMRKVTLATGTAAAPFLKELLDGFQRKCNNLICQVTPIRNDFFGTTITVAGLITGQDLIAQLQGKDLGDELLLPTVMLRHEQDLFLDNVSIDEVEKALKVPIRLVPNDGWELLNAVLGRKDDV